MTLRDIRIIDERQMQMCMCLFCHAGRPECDDSFTCLGARMMRAPFNFLLI